MDGEYYESSMSVRLSSNYNSVEASVKFGRTARKGESRSSLIKDVDSEVNINLQVRVREAERLLNLKGKKV